MTERQPRVAIVDHGLGNLHSVKQACEFVGLNAVITSVKSEILSADAVILPGVGAFGDAMQTLHRLDLVSVLRIVAESSKPMIGICLGLQLLMSESNEFGFHKGLNIIEGSVNRFDQPKENDRLLKIPQVGWNRVYPARNSINWSDTLLHGVDSNEYMYFVHSYIVQPQNGDVVLTLTRYGNIEFCSGINYRNICAFQFHPERSGPKGIMVSQNLAAQLRANVKGNHS